MSRSSGGRLKILVAWIEAKEFECVSCDASTLKLADSGVILPTGGEGGGGGAPVGARRAWEDSAGAGTFGGVGAAGAAGDDDGDARDYRLVVRWLTWLT